MTKEEISEVIETFPEPFKTAARKERFSFDYLLNKGRSDHAWLKEHGYEPIFGSDCSYYVAGLNGLNATSYGDWGSVCNYWDEESFDAFCQMYKEGIVRLWRITYYKNRQSYSYADGNWKTYYNGEWIDCESPL